MLEAELEAERERIRILNKTPVNFLNPREALRKEKAAKRRQLKKQFDFNLPAWILNPLNEIDYDAEASKLELERDLLEAQRMQEQKQAEEQRLKELAEAKEKTHLMQKKALKVICRLQPKRRARAAVRLCKK